MSKDENYKINLMNAKELMEITIAHENKIEDILKLCEQRSKAANRN